jgi:hypothetical protein
MDIEEASQLVAQFLGIEIGRHAEPKRARRRPSGETGPPRNTPGQPGSQQPRGEPPSRRSQATPAPTKEVVTEAALARLVDALQVLDPSEAESIYNSVQSGVMPISDATRFVEDFVRRSGSGPPATIEDSRGRDGSSGNVRDTAPPDHGYDEARSAPLSERRAPAAALKPSVQTGTLSLFASVDMGQGLMIAVDTLCAQYAVVKPLALGYLASNPSSTQKRVATEVRGAVLVMARLSPS